MIVDWISSQLRKHPPVNQQRKSTVEKKCSNFKSGISHDEIIYEVSTHFVQMGIEDMKFELRFLVELLNHK